MTVPRDSDDNNPYAIASPHWLTDEQTEPVRDSQTQIAHDMSAAEKARGSVLKAHHRVEHSADVVHLIMRPKIWKEDYLQGLEQDDHRQVAWSEVPHASQLHCRADSVCSFSST